jgi:hypothetical protein
MNERGVSPVWARMGNRQRATAYAEQLRKVIGPQLSSLAGMNRAAHDYAPAEQNAADLDTLAEQVEAIAAALDLIAERS